METTHESSNQALRSAQPAKPYAFSRKVFCEGMRDGVPIALGYFAVPQKARRPWLLLACYFFYFCWNPAHVPVLAFVTAVGYLGGRLLEGARGLGGEMGHYRTHAQHGLLCTCGAVGCWEQYASTTALVRGAHAIDPNLKDGRAIFAAAEAGNPLVLDLIDRWTDEIAQGLAGMVHIFNPQLILIGGGVSAQEKFLIEPVAAKVRRSIMPAFAEGLEIRAAQLHNDAGMVGAVYYFRQTMENT